MEAPLVVQAEPLAATPLAQVHVFATDGMDGMYGMGERVWRSCGHFMAVGGEAERKTVTE